MFEKSGVRLLLTCTLLGGSFVPAPAWAADTPAQTQLKLGQTLAEQGKWPQAQAAFQKVLQSEPQNADAHYYLGRSLSQQGQEQLAIQSFIRAVTINPRLFSAHHQMGLSYEKLKQPQKAIQILQNLLLMGGDLQAIQYDLGRLYQATQQEAKALASFQAVYRESPDYQETSFRLAQLYASKDPAKAVKLLEENLKKQPKFAPAYLLLGRITYQGGQTQIGKKYIEEALSLAPKDPEAHYLLATCAYDQKSPQTTVFKHLDQALKLNPDHIDALALKGVLYYESQAYDQAIELFARGLKLAPQRADLQRNLAVTWVKKGEAEKALAAFKHYLLSHPQAEDAPKIQKLILDLQGILERSHTL